MFGRQRDVSLFRHINRELINNIITQQIGYYKYQVEDTTNNIYGETPERFFIDPVLLNCLITRGDQVWSDPAIGSEFGVDEVRNLGFAFLRDDLKDASVSPQVGDIIMWYEGYYEVDSIVSNQLFVGKDPDYAYSEGMDEFGYDVSIICQTHYVPADKLGITKERS